MTIPARRLVSVTPGVISGGGSALSLTALVLSDNPLLAAGVAEDFTSLTAVGTFFGELSAEYLRAKKYFGGISQITTRPGKITFMYYATASRQAQLIGASLSGMTLSQLQALTPSTIALTVNGTLKTSTSLDFSAVASFSAAAAQIQAAFTSGPTVTYNSTQSCFIFTAPTAQLGAASSITVAATSTVATGLKLTAATNATVSPGVNADTPAAFMDDAIVLTQSWASLLTVFEPSQSDKLLFASWANSQPEDCMYVGWDTDANAADISDSLTTPTTFGGKCKLAQYNGVICVSGDTALASDDDIADSAFIFAGIWASINFTKTNGRVTAAGSKQAGMAITVSDDTKAQNLLHNGYSYIGLYGTKANTFGRFDDGALPGEWLWADSFYNQIWLNDQFQVAGMNFLDANGSAPYNDAGYTALRAAYSSPIAAAVNFGMVVAGVDLSEQELADVMEAAGMDLSNVLQTQGWYLQIEDPGTDVRLQRGSPLSTFWYCDGQAIQSLALSSVDIL